MGRPFGHVIRHNSNTSACYGGCRSMRQAARVDACSRAALMRENRQAASAALRGGECAASAARVRFTPRNMACRAAPRVRRAAMLSARVVTGARAAIAMTFTILRLPRDARSALQMLRAQALTCESEC